ncbi:MAG: phenylalanine--tRNA ligase subunit alpha [Patescibacteria group bacterium]
MTLEQIKKSFLTNFEAIEDLKSLEFSRIKYLGRKGELSKILRTLKDLPLQKRKKIGNQANILRREIEKLLDEKFQKLQTVNHKPQTTIDVTRPGEKASVGHLNPLMKFEEEVIKIFTSMNFSVVEGPEIENEYYNFDALNIPPDHPAREMWDTFWLKESKNTEKLLLRTHTSPVQIRYMEKHNPPFAIIAPGRVFRHEATDASHEINFDQLEGLMLGKDISLANFKFIVEEFFKKLFGPKIQFKFTPSYFPFVEPGVEVHIKLDNGKWLEVAGAGMVHKKVFEAAKYNPYEWQGFAFGFGLNRLAMIKYKIPDVRLFYSGDLRFIKQF